MKKFGKIVGFIALGALVLGIVFVSIGAIGGGWSGLGNLIKSGELSFGDDDFALMDMWDDDFDPMDMWDDEEPIYSVEEDMEFNNDYETYTQGEVSVDVAGSDVRELEIELGGSEVILRESADENWHISADNIGRFQAYEQNGTLYIIGVKRGVNVKYTSVTIEVPADAYLAEVEISLGAGKMTIIDGLNAREMNFEIGAGVLDASALTAGELEISVGAGEAIVKDSTIQELEVSVGMGSAVISGEISGDISGEVAMGEMVITVEGSSEGDHNYELSCAAGSLQVGSQTYNGMGKDIEIQNGAASTYELDCAFGQLTVRFSN